VIDNLLVELTHKGADHNWAHWFVYSLANMDTLWYDIFETESSTWQSVTSLCEHCWSAHSNCHLICMRWTHHYSLHLMSTKHI